MYFEIIILYLVNIEERQGTWTNVSIVEGDYRQFPGFMENLDYNKTESGFQVLVKHTLPSCWDEF